MNFLNRQEFIQCCNDIRGIHSLPHLSFVQFGIFQFENYSTDEMLFAGYIVPTEMYPEISYMNLEGLELFFSTVDIPFPVIARNLKGSALRTFIGWRAMFTIPDIAEI